MMNMDEEREVMMHQGRVIVLADRMALFGLIIMLVCLWKLIMLDKVSEVILTILKTFRSILNVSKGRG